MPDLIVPDPVDGERCVREAVCIHTKRVTDSCRDKDCLDCLRVYPTQSSQTVLDRAMSVKAGCAQLLCAYIDVEPVSFNRGFYAVDVRYCYRVTADAFVGAGRPVEITGLAVFDKRVILYGGEGGAKVFTSSAPCHLGCPGAPEAVVEAVDPLILAMKLVDVCDCHGSEYGSADIPEGLLDQFGEELVFGGDARRLFVTLGQFSIVRLERDAQLLIPVYDYCVPEKECTCGGGSPCVEDPCELFEKVQFPVERFCSMGGGKKECGC